MNEPGADPARRLSSLGQRAARAGFWNIGANVLRDGVQFAAMLVLVRLLTPDDYGRYGLASAVIGFMFVFSARSIADYALQERRDERVYWRDYFSFGAAIELALFLATNVVGALLPLSARFAGAAPLVHVLSLLFLSNWPKEICVKMLQRELDWRRFRLLWLAAALVSSALSVALALAGAGAQALAIPAVLLPLVFWVELFLVRRWAPRWGWEQAHIAPALGFAASRAGSGLLGGGRGLLESGAFTAFLGFAALGVYGRAVGLAQIGCGRFVDLLVDAVYPALTKLEAGSDRFRRAATNVIRLALWIAVPAALLLAALAALLVPVLYGSQWTEVVPLAAWAAAMVAAASVQRSLYLVLLAGQRQRLCLALDALVLAGTLIAASVALPRAVADYLGAMTACYGAVLAVAAGMAMRYRLVDLAALAHALAIALLGGGAGLLLAGALVDRTADGALAALAALVLYLSVFAVAYLAVLRALAPRALAELLRFLPAGARLLCWLRLDGGAA